VKGAGFANFTAQTGGQDCGHGRINWDYPVAAAGGNDERCVTGVSGKGNHAISGSLLPHLGLAQAGCSVIILQRVWRNPGLSGC